MFRGFTRIFVCMILHVWRGQSRELRKSLGTWLREIDSCSCLTLLPGPAWVLLSKIANTFSQLCRHAIFLVTLPESLLSLVIDNTGTSTEMSNACNLSNSLGSRGAWVIL